MGTRPEQRQDLPDWRRREWTTGNAHRGRGRDVRVERQQLVFALDAARAAKNSAGSIGSVSLAINVAMNVLREFDPSCLIRWCALG